MRLLILTGLALIAFASNSVLTRAAIDGQGMPVGAFTGARMISGALALWLLVAVSRSGGWRQGLSAGSWAAAAALLGYALAFSFAYLTLDAGIGALILFAGVQVTMFAGGLARGERPGTGRWVGAALGLSGLAWLLLPGAGLPDLSGAFLMTLAAVGWGLYSLYAKGSGDPLVATTSNFLRAAPFCALFWLLMPGLGGGTAAGYGLAIASGALASGVGYAIWYAALARLDASLAAVAQLLVPVLALGGGVLFLGEVATLRFVVSAALVSIGVLIAVFWTDKRA